eukprot:gene9018-9190_t
MKVAVVISGLCLLLLATPVVLASDEVEAAAAVPAAVEISSLTSKAKTIWKNPTPELKDKLYKPESWMCTQGSRGCSPAYKAPQRITSWLKYSWHNKFNCRKRGCPAGCPNPYPFFITAYDYIDNNPSLTTLATLLDLFAEDPAYAPVVDALKGDFAGTILAPINSAFDEYTKQMAVSVTTPGVLPFLFQLVTYHVLGESLYLSELRPGRCYTTLYEGLDGSATEICWGEAAEYSKAMRSAFSRKGWKTWRNRSKWVSWRFYFIDEQENTIPVVCADKWVAGGGVIHTVSKVAQPADLFPSVAVAAVKNNLTSLAAAVTKVGLLGTLEQTISIVFAPTNQAFAAVLTALNTTLAGIDPAVLTPVLQYHVCAFPTIDARNAAYDAGSCPTLLGPTLTWTPTHCKNPGEGADPSGELVMF